MTVTLGTPYRRGDEKLKNDQCRESIFSPFKANVTDQRHGYQHMSLATQLTQPHEKEQSNEVAA
jgi:hypothetical protein